jgi:hypothetical protein
MNSCSALIKGALDLAPSLHTFAIAGVDLHHPHKRVDEVALALPTFVWVESHPFKGGNEVVLAPLEVDLYPHYLLL